MGKKINLVLNSGNREFYGKLDEVQKELPPDLFLKIHKSYLINRNLVREYTYEWVKMSNGDVLNISKVNRAAVRKQILESEM